VTLPIHQRMLTRPATFIIEVGTDGFNAYSVAPDGERVLFAASGSTLTFIRVMERIANTHMTGDRKILRFSVLEEDQASRPDSVAELLLQHAHDEEMISQCMAHNRGHEVEIENLKRCIAKAKSDLDPDEEPA